MVEEKRNEKVKVIDRRWLDADGTPKEPLPISPTVATTAPASKPAAPQPTQAPRSEVAAPPPTQAPPIAPPTAAQETTSEAAEAPPHEAGFLDLVDFLAQQAVALLSGQVPGRGRDPATARFFIDLLGVLQEKTAGRLGREEAGYLEDVLYQLRSLFLAATR